SVLYAGVLNDKEFGGVFISRDSGQTWKQMSEGLGGRDVFVLRQAADHSLLAGTDHGIFQLKANTTSWALRNALAPVKPVTAVTKTAVAKTAAAKKAAVQPAMNDTGARISVLETAGQRWFAATSTGFFVSADAGATWKQESPAVGVPVSISVAGKMVAVAS